jgi:hypothetical protein
MQVWSSWAIYVCFILVVTMGAGIFFMRRRDAADELNMARIKKNQKRIYVNLYLEPIKEI